MTIIFFQNDILFLCTNNNLIFREVLICIHTAMKIHLDYGFHVWIVLLNRVLGNWNLPLTIRWLQSLVEIWSRWSIHLICVEKHFITCSTLLRVLQTLHLQWGKQLETVNQYISCYLWYNKCKFLFLQTLWDFCGSLYARGDSLLPASTFTISESIRKIHAWSIRILWGNLVESIPIFLLQASLCWWDRWRH